MTLHEILEIGSFAANIVIAILAFFGLRQLSIGLGQLDAAKEQLKIANRQTELLKADNGLKNQKTKQDAAPRTKENVLRQIVSLFNFARRQKYVPDEMRAILAAADAEVSPALSIP